MRWVGCNVLTSLQTLQSLFVPRQSAVSANGHQFRFRTATTSSACHPLFPINILRLPAMATKVPCLTANSGGSMQSFLQNVSFTLRQLRKSPGFTITVILTLALGIGANAAVFTLFDQVLLRMLPVQQPQQLVRFHWTGGYSGGANIFGGEMYDYFSYLMYKDLRDKNQVFSGIAAVDKTNVGVNWNNQAEDQDAELVTGNYFQVLGLQPVIGRLLAPQDDTAKGANPQLVLAYAYWKSRFAGSPAVIGQTLRINGQPLTIVG